MRKIIFLLFMIGLLFQSAPTCGKFDRRRYIVAPVCTPQPIRPIEPIGLH
jgi:hypothetical protein